ncbi:type II toxin-antitoxin system prevent-host-death family antitoxin (plasmid) [Vibrio sp. SS-MA-C1-2]|uniref:type II toxin-antitoxin system prevent-host-death family antitoxin n=1 Tax=Vibrio sp. SS-MA-C1-2 TaxID=2908646 RepID=UPI001F35F460|nr:type II toxin-antitoxin system prevent-host-death family antitoxin [Vibrio sp. SS-MA-C1-2]UJF20198.1 type II toxin-antitoxin system prevent-host-death family antitoxin [Vibrio sp. SS-MA-C1-2]
MKASTIYAQKAISSSEARKHFKDCLSGEPVVILSNNEPAGYMMSASFFESLMKALESKNATSISSFRPMSARLEAIAHLNVSALENIDNTQLGEFEE